MTTRVPASINDKWHIFHSYVTRLEWKRRMEKTGNSRLLNNLIMLYQLHMNSRGIEGCKTIHSSGRASDVNSEGTWFEFGLEHPLFCTRFYAFPPGKFRDKALFYVATVFNQILSNLIKIKLLTSWISPLHRSLHKITSTINQQMHLYNFHLKHLKPIQHVSIFSDHHQGISSFPAKVITYSRFSSFL